MRTLSRRAFVKMVASLVAFVPVARALALGESTNRQQTQVSQVGQVVDKTYATGVVLAVSGNQIALNTPYRGPILLNLLPSTDVWEGAWVKDMPIETGDQIKAWGRLRDDGTTLDVELMYVNIVNLRGTISNVQQDSAQGLRVQHYDSRQGLHIVKIDALTEYHRADGQKVTHGGSPVNLQEGQPLQVIGRKLKDGSVIATDLLF